MAVFPVSDSPLIFPGCSLWLPLFNPNGNGVIPANNTAISALVDVSGFSNTFPQASGSSQALFQRNIVGNLGMMLFDGINDYYELAFKSNLNTTNCIIYTVHTNGSVNTNFRAIYSNRGIAGANGYGLTYYRYPSNDPQASKLSYFCNQGTSSPNSIFGPVVTANNSILYLTEFSVTAGVATLWINGTTYGTANFVGQAGFSTAPSRVGAGQTEGAANYFHSGYIGEIINFTNSAVVDKTYMRRQLANRWGISI